MVLHFCARVGGTFRKATASETIDNVKSKSLDTKGIPGSSSDTMDNVKAKTQDKEDILGSSSGGMQIFAKTMTCGAQTRSTT